MKEALQQRFERLNTRYKQAQTSLATYLATLPQPECASSGTCAPAAQTHPVIALKQKLDALLGAIEQELSKDQGDINYELYTHKISAAEALFVELEETTKPTWKKVADSLTFQLAVVLFLKAFIFGWYCVPTGSAEPNLLVGDRIIANKTAYWFSPVKRGDLAVFDSPEVPYSKNWLVYAWQRFVGMKVPLFGLPAGPENFVKRVIAIPGDIIEGKIEDGKPVVYRNGEKLVEPYVNTLPLIAVQKMNGFFSPKNPIIRALPSWLARPFVLRKSENCNGQPSFYTYDPSVPYDQQPYYKLDEHEVLKNPFTGKPYLRKAGEADPYDTFIKMRVPEGKYWCEGDSRRNSRDCRSWGFLDGNLIRGKASIIVYSINSEEIWWLFDILKNPIDFWTKKLRPERSFTVLRNPLPESEQL